MNVFLVWVDWVGDSELIEVFLSREKAEAWIEKMDGTPTPKWVYNKTYRKEMFSIQEWVNVE